MSTELSIPKTDPKPRKEDVINALVIVARQKHAEKIAKHREELTAAKEALEKAAHAYAIKNAAKLTPQVNSYGDRFLEVEFRIPHRDLPAPLAKVREKFKALESSRPKAFDEKEAARDIREALSESDDRVQALLANKDFITKANGFLADIF